MKKLLHILLALCLLLAFSACEQTIGQPIGPSAADEPTAVPAGEPAAPVGQPDESPAPPAETDAPEDIPAVTDDPGGNETPDDIDFFAIYRSFLEENFNRLSELCYGGIAGVGFIDLDLDGAPEMLLFDSGASASMGIQFFDIIGPDGNVECVSANMMDLGSEFGGEHYSAVYVNANYFDDFRLMRSANGEMRFFVSSGNGALDFSYSELIEFGTADGALALFSRLYRHDDYDIESGEASSTHCTKGDEAITAAEYEAALAEFRSDWQDTGYDAFGVFIWEGKSYSTEYDGFMAMLDAAVNGYVPLPE